MAETPGYHQTPLDRKTTTPSISTSTHTSTTLIPPLRFGIVQKNTYRGSYPRPLNFPFIQTLSLKCVVSITPEPVIESTAKWFIHQGVKLIHIPPRCGKKNVPLSHSDVKNAIECLINEEFNPIYLHCLNGSEATGLTIACLRKLQYWATPAISSELQRFSEVHNSFEAFVDGFTTDVIEIPMRTPQWLWQGIKDNNGVIGQHRLRIRYKDEKLEQLHRERLTKEAQSDRNSNGVSLDEEKSAGKDKG